MIDQIGECKGTCDQIKSLRAQTILGVTLVRTQISNTVYMINGFGLFFAYSFIQYMESIGTGTIALILTLYANTISVCQRSCLC